MAVWFPVTAQHFSAAPQPHLEAPAFAPLPHMHPICFAPPSNSHLPYHMYPPMPVPMPYTGTHDVWVPAQYAAAAAGPRPAAYTNGAYQRALDMRRQPQHSIATHRQWQHPDLHATQYSDHEYCHPPPKQNATTPLTGASNSQTHSTRKQLDHLARCWSPASAATSSHSSTAASSSSTTSRTGTWHQPGPQASHLQQHSQSAVHQLDRLQLTNHPDTAVSTSEAAGSGGEAVTAQPAGGREGQGNSEAAAWQGLTEGLLKDVIGLLPPHCNKRCRLVCRRWRDTLDGHLQGLVPKHAQVHMFQKLFPAITALDLSGCQNVRNRNLAILSKSGLKISSLVIGHTALVSYGKPRITNQALQNIAAFSGLQKLVLADCSAVTTGGLDQLSGLTGLTHLALLRLARVGHMGLTLVQTLTCLTYLAFTGSSKVGDSSMQSVAAVSSLRHLALGYTRVGDPGLALLGSLPNLTRLHLIAEAITPTGLQEDQSASKAMLFQKLVVLALFNVTSNQLVAEVALSSMVGLQALGLSQCTSLSGEDVLAVITNLTALTHLSLHSIHLSTEHIYALTKGMPQLRTLGLQGSSVHSPAMAALASLSALRCLSLSITPNSAHDLTTITSLSQITALQVQGIAPTPALVQCLGQMPGLRGLDLHHYEGRVGNPLTHILSNALVQHLGHCKHLTWLDISLWTLNETQVSRLIQQLPALQQICLFGCPIESCASLDDRFPSISFERTPTGSLWDTHTVGLL